MLNAAMGAEGDGDWGDWVTAGEQSDHLDSDCCRGKDYGHCGHEMRLRT